MDQSPKQVPQLYVVVCIALHTAIGPFADAASALRCAREYTDTDSRDSCVYLPIPLVLPAGSHLSTVPAPDVVETGHPGQYL